jgi:hypothetical protein
MMGRFQEAIYTRQIYSSLQRTKMARKNVDKNIDREEVLNKCADQVIALGKRNSLTVDELLRVLRRARKAAVVNAKI